MHNHPRRILIRGILASAAALALIVPAANAGADTDADIAGPLAPGQPGPPLTLAAWSHPLPSVDTSSCGKFRSRMCFKLSRSETRTVSEHLGKGASAAASKAACRIIGSRGGVFGHTACSILLKHRMKEVRSKSQDAVARNKCVEFFVPLVGPAQILTTDVKVVGCNS